jgi:S-adenosylmethionine:tRNA ribosyltransferase-isomerase
MLVTAFYSERKNPEAGIEDMLNAYKEAIEEGYRFYSYGDCMLII